MTSPPPAVSVEPLAAESFPAEYIVTELDALRYSRQCMVAALVLFAAYGFTLAGMISPWVLALVVVLVLPRWIINVHELLHIYDETQLNRLICLLGVSPVPLSILTLSYPELRQIHFGHHRSPAMVDDPDAYHIRGHWLAVILGALTAPEQRTLRWIAAHGLSPRLGFDLAVKLLLLGGLAWTGGLTFLGFWLTFRLVYALGDLAFFRLVHHQKGEYGSFALTLPQPLQTLIGLIWGQTVTQAVLNHDIHHQNPYIAAHYLALARCDRNSTLKSALENGATQ